MNVLVLGAGLIGVTSAWYLARDGHTVTVIDRQPAAGLETSFANGGQISVSHSEPWASPKALTQLWQWLGREDAPLYFKLRASFAQWRWGLGFLRECTAQRFEANARALLDLGLYSRTALQDLRTETSIQYDELTRGILHFFTDAKSFANAKQHAEGYQRHGLDVRVKTPNECVAIEPALRGVHARLAGGTYTGSDETGDAHLFTQRLATLCAAQGVTFRYNTNVHALLKSGAQIDAVTVIGPNGFERLQADTYVVAMGSYSPLLLNPIGVRVPVYPLKGYSVTAPIRDAAKMTTVSVTDDDAKIVVTRLGNRVRAAGTAELNGYETDINQTRAAAILRHAQSLFPEGAHWDQATFWAGLRPATPTNNPLIGRTRQRNLFVNTGHGTLGWTLACGSGKVLADAVAGRVPSVKLLHHLS